MCDHLGLWHLHIPDSRRASGAAGWPDLVIIGAGGVIFRELKGPERFLSPWQTYVLQSLKRAGCDVGMWRPQDWESGAIQQTLKTLSLPAP